MDAPNSDSINSKKESRKSLRSKKDMWKKEVDGASKRLRKFHTKGAKIVERFKGGARTGSGTGTSRLNLFHSNIKTLSSMLYGNLPTVEVSRRYADSDDDAARVAAEMMERLLNCDIQENGKEYDAVLKSVLQDRLIPGIGCARVRYEMESEEVPQTDEMTGEVTMVEQLTYEYAPVEYYYWKDVIWSWGRNFSTLRWLAFRNYLDKDAFIKRFGKEKAKNMEFKRYSTDEDVEEGRGADADTQDSLKKTEVWEIWDRDTEKVIWYTDKSDELLDEKEDTLKLKGFFPTPPFFMANPTTTNYLPTPDFALSEDLYNEIDQLQTRINKITEAVKVVGVYDKGSEGVQDMLQEGQENRLIPVESWALFSEKGGLSKSIEWMPVGEIVEALNKLVVQRNDAIALLHQTSGMADVMRGGLDNQYEGNAQTNDKVKFGSIRIQALQDEFARFAGDLMQLKAEIISKHFDPQTIVKKSNMGFNQADQKHIPAAIEVIKSDEMPARVIIRPESVAMVDFAQLKAERTEFLAALSGFLKTSTPMMEKEPSTTPYLLKLLQWGLAGFKGASEIEGVMDKAIDAVTKAMEQGGGKKPDPNAAKAQGEMQKIQAKLQADMQVREFDKKADIETLQAQQNADLTKIQAESAADLAEIEAKAVAARQTEQHQSQTNAAQHEQGVIAEMQKNMQKMQLELEKIKTAAAIDIQKEAIKADINAQHEQTKANRESKDDD